MMIPFKPYFCKKMLKPPAGLFDVSYSALMNGSLAVLRSDCDVLGHWHHNLEKGFHDKAILGKDAKGFLYISDGDLEWPVMEFPLESPFPLFDRRPNGEWIFVQSRCSFAEENAICYDPSGRVLRRFNVGDAVQHIQSDVNGMLWVGYFDEGFYRNKGWNKSGLRSSFDVTGLLQFNSDGQPVWASPVPILDCHALNVAERVWAYYYPEFEVLEIGSDGIEKTWKTDIQGAKAFAVAGCFALFAGGYGDNYDQVVLVECKNSVVKKLATFKLKFYREKTTCFRPTFFGGRGPLLHLVYDNVWVRLNIHEMCSEI